MNSARAWVALGLVLAGLVGILALGTPRVPPSFPSLDPARCASVDWPLTLPMAWLAALALLPWAFRGEGRRHLARGLLVLALLPSLWLSLHPEPWEEQRLLKVDHGVTTITVVEGGELVQRQWLRSVQTDVPLLQLPRMIRSERSLAGIAHAIHHQADPAPEHGFPRALLWAIQRWVTTGWLVLRFLTLPLAAWLTAAAAWPRLLPQRRWVWLTAGLGLLLPLALPPLANLGLLGGIAVSGLPDAGDQAGSFALQQLAWLGIIGLGIGAAALARRAFVAASAAAMTMLLMGCPSSEAPPDLEAEFQPTTTAQAAAPEAPDIVLVLAAGARARMGTGEDSAPVLRHHLDATGVTMFGSAYAQSPSSFVSLGSVLTGRYPSAIPMCGLPTLDAAGGEASERPWCAAIPEDRHTLPQVLGLYGYETGLLHANLPAGEVFQGHFEHARDMTRSWDDGRADWESIHRQAVEFWQTGHDKPHLLVLVVSDLVVHQRPDVAARTGWSGRVPQVVEPMLAHQPELAQAVTGPADQDQLYATYQQAVMGLGGGIKGLLKLLAEARSDRPRWVIVAGLNGINLGEPGGGAEDHPTWGANQLLLERTVHVPLFVIPPDRETVPSDVTQPVELVDLFPTVAKLAGAMPPASLPGQDLLERPFPENPRAWAYAAHGDMLALRQGRMMYAVRGMFHNGTALDPEVTDFLIKAPEAGALRHLYDVIDDPLQQHDLAALRHGDLDHMHRMLVDIQTTVAAPPEGSLTTERLWELRMTRSEGYW